MPKQAGRLPSNWPNPTPQWTRPAWAPDLEGLKHLERELTAADVAQVEGFLPLYSAEVGFCGNVPLDSGYQNTYYFGTIAERIKYFKAKMRVKGGAPDLTDYDNNDNYFIYNNTSEIRNNGVILISTASRNLDNCNYLFYHDPYFDNADVERQRWIFAFIDHVEYIAPSSCAVYYTVDVFQTYWPDIWIKPSYIERMTPDTDSIFSNTVPEGVEFGPNKISQTRMLSAMNMHFTDGSGYASPTPDGFLGTMFPGDQWYYSYYYTTPESDGTPVNNKYWIPLSKSSYLANDGSQIQSMSAFFQNNGHQIVMGYLLPGWLAFTTNDMYEGTLDALYNFGPVGNAAKLDGYTPVNKKLYTYPYSYLEVTNNQGSSLELHWEDWDDAPGNFQRSAKFKLAGIGGLLPEIYLMPVGYLGQTTYAATNSILTIGDFPQVPWVSDTFNQWLQTNLNRYAQQRMYRQDNLTMEQWQNGINGTIGSLGSAADAVGAGLSGEWSDMGKSAASSLTGISDVVFNHLKLENQKNQNTMEFPAIVRDMRATPDTVGGMKPGSLFNFMTDTFGYSFNVMTIKKEYAYKIDTFFTKRGYKMGYIMTPDLSVRPRGYKYIEAPNMQLLVKNDSFERGVPSPAVAIMRTAFSNGMTWWTPPQVVPGQEPDDTVGNYGAWLPTPPFQT